MNPEFEQCTLVAMTVHFHFRTGFPIRLICILNFVLFSYPFK